MMSSSLSEPTLFLNLVSWDGWLGLLTFLDWAFGVEVFPEDVVDRG